MTSDNNIPIAKKLVKMNWFHSHPQLSILLLSHNNAKNKWGHLFQ